MKLKVIILGLVTGIYSCSPATLNGKEAMLENVSYIHLHYNTEKECLDSQQEQNFFFNCHQQVDFYEDNKVEIMLTDVYWRGTYKMEGTTVVLTFEPNHEIPQGEIIFEVINPVLLYNLDNGNMWKKLSGNNIWK